MNKSVYTKLLNLRVMFMIYFFVHVSYSFWPLNQNILMILWHQLLLYLIRLNIMCVFCFHFIRSRPTAPPTELRLLTEQALGPGGGCRCCHCTCYYCLLYHTPNVSICTCILSLNAAIQNSESNHHSGKTLLQEWATLLMWSNRTADVI